MQYSEINNTRALIEIAHKEGDYTPGVSFGTHFFLDLVEKGIHYLPLYPDDSAGSLNKSFFADSPNEGRRQTGAFARVISKRAIPFHLIGESPLCRAANLRAALEITPMIEYNHSAQKTKSRTLALYGVYRAVCSRGRPDTTCGGQASMTL